MGCATSTSHPLEKLKAVKVKCCLKQQKYKSKRMALRFVNQVKTSKRDSVSTNTSIEHHVNSDTIEVPASSQLSDSFTEYLQVYLKDVNKRGIKQLDIEEPEKWTQDNHKGVTYIQRKDLFKHILKAILYFDVSTPRKDINLTVINIKWERQEFEDLLQEHIPILASIFVLLE